MMEKMYNDKKTLSLLVILSLFLSMFLIFVMVNDEPNAQGARASDNEPNNTFPGAIVLMNDSVEGEVTDLDDVDFYKVTLLPGQTVEIRFEAHSFSQMNLLLKFYNLNGDELWTFGAIHPGEVKYYNYTLNRTTESPYYIGIRPEGTGNTYTLTTSIRSQNDAGSGTDAPDQIKDATQIFGGTTNGYLAGIDRYDYYMIKVGPGRIINFNLSTKKNSSPVSFYIYNDTKYFKIKSIPSVAQNMYVKYQYTTNSSGTFKFYIGVNIPLGGKSNYSISLALQLQDDATSYQDAGDNLSAALLLSKPGNYTGWLGGGKAGIDVVDAYFFTVPPGNHSININITQSPMLNIVVYIYNDLLKNLETFNPSTGARVYLIVNISTSISSNISVKLMTDPGITTSGEYNLEYSIQKSTQPPKPTDGDKDGLPDTWEVEYFGNTTKYGASDDPDSDGFSNLDEFKAKTDPMNNLSYPASGFSHLTTEACKRTYKDAASDVFYWSGTHDEPTEQIDIIATEIIDSPNYDILVLESARVDDTLIVKLKISGKVEDLGGTVAFDDGSNISGTFYSVFFVNTTFKETKFDDTDLPKSIITSDQLIPAFLLYSNNTFIGSPGTVGQKLDSDKTLQWHIPLDEITELNTDFGLYGFVYHFEMINNSTTRTRNTRSFRAYSDSVGVGSDVLKPDIVTEVVKKVVIIDDHKIDVSITTDGSGGNVIINKADKPNITIPENHGDLGIYIDINFIGGPQANEIFFTIEYNDSSVPEGFDENNIKAYYFNETSNKWEKIADSGVWANNNTIWARPKHLTIFTALAEPDASDPTDDGDRNNWMAIILVMIVIIVVVVIVLGMFVMRSRSSAKRRHTGTSSSKGRPRRALSPKFFECPQCGENIEILDSGEDKVLLQCPECGSKGKVDNPYLGMDRKHKDRDREPEYGDERRPSDHDRDYDRGDRDQRQRGYPDSGPRRRSQDHDHYGDRSGSEFEEDIDYKQPTRRRENVSDHYDREDKKEETDEDYEYKTCPKCRKKIPIPYVEEEKVVIKCPNCGAKGKVKNPYI